MEENSKSNVAFNIYGGNNQILPNATEAVQNFYGDQFADQKLHSEGESTDAPNEDEQRLAIYINKVKSLRGYISLLTACKKAKEVGEVVATMCQNEEAIDADLIAKKDFIHLLLPFLTNVKTGKGVDNLRLYINNAWDARKKAIRQSNR